MKRGPWLTRMEVTGSKGDTYVVAIARDGSWGCSCPAWKFARAHGGAKPPCKHINAVRSAIPRAPSVGTIGARFSGLDFDAAPVLEAMPVGTRFRHLDFQITTIH